MTADEWLACDDPTVQAAQLFQRPNPRKLRLWGCACGRELVPFFEQHGATDLADFFSRFEEVAEGIRKREDEQKPLQKLRFVGEKLQKIPGISTAILGIAFTQWIEIDATEKLRFSIGLVQMATARARNAYPTLGYEWDELPSDPNYRAIFSPARLKQAAMAHDIFGNPFRPVAFDPAWRTPKTERLATRMTAKNQFDKLPALADELAAVGCNEPEVLEHCRGPGPHVRGCWVLDAILGKS